MTGMITEIQQRIENIKVNQNGSVVSSDMSSVQEYSGNSSLINMDLNQSQSNSPLK